jgi:hypothetical protein
MYIYVGKYQWDYPSIIRKLLKRECGPRIFLPLKCDPGASEG